MPLEVVVGGAALRVAGVPDVADDLTRVHRAHLPVGGEVGVVHVTVCTADDDGVPAERIGSRVCDAVERSHDRRPLRREDVVAGVRVVAARVPRRTEIVPHTELPLHGTHEQRTLRVQHGGCDHRRHGND